MTDIEKAVSIKSIQLNEFGDNYRLVYVLYSLHLCHKYIHHLQVSHPLNNKVFL